MIFGKLWKIIASIFGIAATTLPGLTTPAYNFTNSTDSSIGYNFTTENIHKLSTIFNGTSLTTFFPENNTDTKNFTRDYSLNITNGTYVTTEDYNPGNTTDNFTTSGDLNNGTTINYTQSPDNFTSNDNVTTSNFTETPIEFNTTAVEVNTTAVEVNTTTVEVNTTTVETNTTMSGNTTETVNTSSLPSTTVAPKKKQPLSKGAIAGIVIGTILLVAVIGAAIVYFVKRGQANNERVRLVA